VSSHTPDPGSVLDRAVREIREEPISQDYLDEMAARVKARLASARGRVLPHPALQAETIDGCGGYQSLIPAYLTASISPSRKLLFEDHISDCVVCRNALNAARRPGGTVLAEFFPKSRFWTRAGLAVAALALVAVALTRVSFIEELIRPIEVHANTNVVDGNLYAISGQDIRPLSAGQRIERNQLVRTGPGSGAILELADKTRIEMAERSELVLDRARDGVNIKLERGSMIVSAAKQRNGHLYVTTADFNIRVVGTVFAVSALAKGSRVSVLEGVVQVEESSRALLAGQQMTSGPGVTKVAIEDDVRWSRELSRHLDLIRSHLAVSAALTNAIGNAPLRTTSDLVPLAPADTLLFASFPNSPQSLKESYELMQRRIAENPAIYDWWQTNGGFDSGRLALNQAMELVSRLSPYLGPEVIIAAPRNGGATAAVLLSDITRLDDLNAALAAEPLNSALYMRVSGSVFVISMNVPQLQRTLGYQAQPSSNAFQNTAMYRRLADAYREGVGWLLAANLEGLIQTPAMNDVDPTVLGMADAQQLIVEQKTGSGEASYQATLGFKSARRGLTSWLGVPSRMGALEFVSPNAFSVAGVITKDPGQILDDVMAMFQNNPNFLPQMREYEEKNHVDLRYDVASQLANEFLFALDGPLLPNPSWKVIIEVNDAARLQNVLQASVNELNRQAAMDHTIGITLTTERVGGITYYSLTSKDFPAGVHYTFWSGYLIIAPTRALVAEAIQYRNTGSSLARSADFRVQLPADGRDEISGIVYYNLKSIPGASNINIALPGLICLYGQADRIVMSSKGVLGMNLASADFLHNMMSAVHTK
jgi:hypothetical protein